MKTKKDGCPQSGEHTGRPDCPRCVEALKTVNGIVDLLNDRAAGFSHAERFEVLISTLIGGFACTVHSGVEVQAAQTLVALFVQSLAGAVTVKLRQGDQDLKTYLETNELPEVETLGNMIATLVAPLMEKAAESSTPMSAEDIMRGMGMDLRYLKPANKRPC